MKKLLISILINICINIVVFPQYQGNIWCFGDSVGIDFNFTPPNIFKSKSKNSEGSACISDKNGNLLFYTSRYMQTHRHILYNYTHTKIENSDSIVINPSTTQGALILPLPLSKNLYYLFHEGEDKNDTITPCGNNKPYRYYYSIIDMDKNNGTGEVISKNNILVDDWATEKMIAIRHGNGRDWWIILHSFNDIFYKLLFTPNGIEEKMVQNIGPILNEFYWDCKINNIGQMAVNIMGNKIAIANYSSYTFPTIRKGSLDVFDFDRCNGNIYNWEIIDSSSNYAFYGCAFSPNGNFIYASTINSFGNFINNLYQYKIINNTYPFSKVLISQNDYLGYFGQMHVSQNNKIYVASQNNMFLHTINIPNEQSTACDLEENALWLGSAKSSFGLPNIPNYSLGPLVGSMCDTLSIVQPHIPPEELWNDTIPANETEEADIFIPNIFSPNNDGQNDVFYVYSNNIKTMTLMIFNRWGERVFETNNINNGWDGTYKSKPLLIGVYVYYLEAELLSGEKFVKRGSVSLVR